MMNCYISWTHAIFLTCMQNVACVLQMANVRADCFCGFERLGKDHLGFETLQKMYKYLENLIKIFLCQFYSEEVRGIEVSLHMFFN